MRTLRPSINKQEGLLKIYIHVCFQICINSCQFQGEYIHLNTWGRKLSSPTAPERTMLYLKFKIIITSLNKKII